MSQGISTIGCKFEYSETQDGTYKAINISSYPDMIGTPEAIDTTTMSDEQYTSIPGVKGSTSASDFGANYIASEYAAIDALGDKEVYQRLTFPDGSGFKWQGMLKVSLAEGSVNGKIGMTLHSFKSTDVEHFTAASTTTNG